MCDCTSICQNSLTNPAYPIPATTCHLGKSAAIFMQHGNFTQRVAISPRQRAGKLQVVLLPEYPERRMQLRGRTHVGSCAGR